MAAISSSQAAEKAEEFMDKAVDALNKTRIFNKGKKHDEAAVWYSKAGTHYKIAKMYQEAGDAYLRSAEEYKESSTPDMAANEYQSAAKCFKLGGFQKDAVKAYEAVVSRLMSQNQFVAAAKVYKEMADVELEDGHFSIAKDLYQKAADCYISEGSVGHANEMLLKVADLAASRAEYKDASELFESVAKTSANNPLARSNVPMYLMSSIISLIPLSLERKDGGKLLESTYREYCDKYAFSRTREGTFLGKLINAYQDKDVEEFTEAVYNYDKMTPLERWRAELLLRAKRSILEDDTDEVDLA